MLQVHFLISMALLHCISNGFKPDINNQHFMVARCLPIDKHARHFASLSELHVFAQRLKRCGFGAFDFRGSIEFQTYKLMRPWLEVGWDLRISIEQDGWDGGARIIKQLFKICRLIWRNVSKVRSLELYTIESMGFRMGKARISWGDWLVNIVAWMYR